MKKFRLVLFGLLLCVLALSPSVLVNAETTIEIYYPYGIEDYVDLNTLSDFDINGSDILYSTKANKVFKYNKITKNNVLVNTENADIRSLNIAGNYAFVLTVNGTYKIFDLNTLTSESAESSNLYSPICSSGTVKYINGKYYFLFLSHSSTSTTMNLWIYNNISQSTHNEYTFTLDDSNYLMAMNDSYIVAKKKTGSKMFVFNQITNSSTSFTPIVKSGSSDNFFEVMAIDNSTETKCVDIIDNNIVVSTTAQTKSVKLAEYTASETAGQGTMSYSELDFTIDRMTIKNGKVYVFNEDNSNIIEYNYNYADKVFDQAKTIIAGKGNEKGRFKNVSHATYHAGELYVSDAGNKRIQILNNQAIFEIGTGEKTCSEIVVDKKNNYYYVLTNNTNSWLYKNGTQVQEITGAKIISIDINIDGKIYMLASNTIYTYGDSLSSISVSGLSINDSSRLRINVDYTDINPNSVLSVTSRALNASIMISTDKTISVVDKITGSITDTFTLTSNIKDFAFNYNNNLVVLDTDGKLIRCGFGATTENFITLDGYSNYSAFDIDIVGGDIYIYNNGTSAFEIIHDTDFSPSGNFLSYYSDINKATGNTKPWNYGVLNINTLIYDHPNYCGNFNEIKNTSTNCIIFNASSVEGSNEGFAYIGYVEGERFKTGYIEITDLNGGIKTIGQDGTNYKVRTTINNVNIYKYPSIYKDTKLNVISQGTVVTTLGKYPISIDGKEYYIVKQNEQFGYIYAKDVVTNENVLKNIKTNAQVKIFDNSTSVVIYVEPDETSNILLSLPDGHKINAIDYNKNEKFCKVNFVDQDGQEREGYMLTKYVKMAGLSPAMITAIILLVLDMIIATCVIIFFTIYRKKQKAEAEKDDE